ncbi:sortase domain-bontaining protein [Streptomyces sp. NPDC002889]|uniref:sortase domain-containing protein n=1 Tax=Streptomyces sp. NPDC002889 TaxID=3364669 RepID=UPI0036B58D7B
MPPSREERPAGSGRLLTGVAWAVLVVGLCLWGRDIAAGPGGSFGPTTGDVAAVGRPLGVAMPPAHEPLEPVAPSRVDVPALGITAPVIPRGLGARGSVEPPPYGMPRGVGWYDGGPRPGARGAALLVGRAGTGSEPTALHGLSAARAGQKIRVARVDGSVAEFTIDDVQVFGGDRSDPRKGYGPRGGGRAELRLITCGDTVDRATRGCTAHMVVSAYLSGVTEP